MSGKRSIVLLWVALVCNFILSAFLYNSFVRSRDRKIVYFDAVKVVSEFYKFKDAQSILQQKAIEYASNLDTLNSELADLKKREVGFRGSREDRDYLKSLLIRKEADIEKYRESSQQSLKQFENDLMQQSVKELNLLVEEYSKKRGYTLVFTGTQLGNIAYGSESLDITPEILALLRKN